MTGFDDQLTRNSGDEEEEIDDSEDVMPHRVDRWEGVPMSMDEMLHIIGNSVNQFGAGWESPFGRFVIVKRTRVVHVESTDDFQSTSKVKESYGLQR